MRFYIQHCFGNKCKTLLSAVCNKGGRDLFLILEWLERIKYLESHSVVVRGVFLYIILLSKCVEVAFKLAVKLLKLFSQNHYSGG